MAETKVAKKTKKLSAWDKVEIARDPKRKTSLEMIKQ